MVSCNELQQQYNDLYSQMRRYIWDMRTIEALADLELACYDLCVDVESVRDAFYALRQLVWNVQRSDEEFEDAFNTFEEFIDENSEIYTPILKVREEVPSSENIEESAESTENKGRRKHFRRRGNSRYSRARRSTNM